MQQAHGQWPALRLRRASSLENGVWMVRANLRSEDGIPSSLWQSKPWWCQPWTILLTGLMAIAGSWLLLHRWWISVPLALAVLLWWWLLLVIVPRAYQAELERDDSLLKE